MKKLLILSFFVSLSGMAQANDTNINSKVFDALSLGAAGTIGAMVGKSANIVVDHVTTPQKTAEESNNNQAGKAVSLGAANPEGKVK